MSDQSFDLDDPEEPGTNKELREAFKTVKKRLSELEAEIPTKLEQAKAEGETVATRRLEATSTFRELGYERFGGLWLNEHPDEVPSVEAAKEFLAAWNVQTGPAPEPVPEEVKQQAGQFQAPIAGLPATAEITRKEYLEMIADPSRRAEAQAAFAAGRVKLSNPQAKDAGSPFSA